MKLPPAIVIAGRRSLPRGAADGGSRRVPDLAGTLAIAAGIGVVVLAVTKATDWGWASEATTTSLLGGLALIAVGLVRSRRHPAPALEIDLWRSRSFAISNLASLFFGAAVYAWLLVGVLFLTAVWRYSELKAGLAMSPGAVSAAIAAAITGRVVDRRGQRGAVVGGALLLAAPPQRLPAAAVFSLASITDYLDGYLARRWRVVSQFGSFCDLMADKLLVAATLIALVSIGLAPAWMVIIIVGRELVVSGLRSWAATQGVVIPAGTWGKGKTLLTLLAIAIAIVDWSRGLSFALLLAATILTLLSALEYLYQAWRISGRHPAGEH